MERDCGERSTGVEYLKYRLTGFGQAYYLKRAVGVIKWGKARTLNRIVHMRSGGHVLGKLGRLFGVGDAQGRCSACAVGERDSPTHLVFGCSTTDSLRVPFWQVLEKVAGATYARSVRESQPAKQWAELMSWLDGEGPFEDEEFDEVFFAFVQMLATQLKVHPSWG